MGYQARRENIVVQTAGNEVMVYDLAINKAYLLNETSAFVWQMCDGENDVSAISRALAEKNNEPLNEDIVKLAIDQLEANNLIESETTPNFFANTDRRAVIKKIGLASMIALPLISSLTAPTAANAASGAGATAACQACAINAECASTLCVNGVCSNGVSNQFAFPQGYSFGFQSQATCTNYGEICCTGATTYDPGTFACNCSTL